METVTRIAMYATNSDRKETAASEEARAGGRGEEMYIGEGRGWREGKRKEVDFENGPHL